jgi:euchromatic histone-lysine N-methyltransferase
VLCARDEGNVARFINHSCEPNLYVQPILSGHTNTDHVLIGLFACRDIPPFTPFRWVALSDLLWW